MAKGMGRGSRRTECCPIPCLLALPPQPHMPLLSIYSLALEQDLEFGHSMVQAVGTLQSQTFMQVGCALECGLGEWVGVVRAVPGLPTHGLSRPSP